LAIPTAVTSSHHKERSVSMMMRGVAMPVGPDDALATEVVVADREHAAAGTTAVAAAAASIGPRSPFAVTLRQPRSRS
jgi:hypothetical protein